MTHQYFTDDPAFMAQAADAKAQLVGAADVLWNTATAAENFRIQQTEKQLYAALREAVATINSAAANGEVPKFYTEPLLAQLREGAGSSGGAEPVAPSPPAERTEPADRSPAGHVTKRQRLAAIRAEADALRRAILDGRESPFAVTCEHSSMGSGVSLYDAIGALLEECSECKLYQESRRAELDPADEDEAAHGDQPPPSSAAQRRAEMGLLVEAMQLLDERLAAFEARLRRGRAYTDDYRDGLYFARQLGAHVAELKTLASDHDASEERKHRELMQHWELQAAIRRAQVLREIP